MDKFRGDQSFRVSSAQGGVSTERKSILIESKNLQDLRFMEETTEWLTVYLPNIKKTS